MKKAFDLEKFSINAEKQTDEFEIYYSKTNNLSVGFENNKLFSIDNDTGEGCGLRVIKNNKLGFSYTTNPEKINNIIDWTVESSNYGQQVKFSFPEQNKDYKKVNLYDENIKDFDLLTKIELGDKLIQKVLKIYPEAKVNISFDKSQGYREILNSNKLNVKEKYSAYSFGISILLVDTKTGILDVYDSESKTHLFSDDIILEKTEKLLKTLENSKKIISFSELTNKNYIELPVIFPVKSVGLLYSSILQGTNGKLVQKGISPLTEKIGEQIIDDRFTIIDNPLLDYRNNSFEFDGEGLPAQKNVIIENGKVNKFIYDIKTASLMNTVSTGNGLRGFSSQPSPVNSNIEIKTSGETTGTYKDIIENMDEGILVESMIGGGQSNILAGDFSVNLDLAFYIKNGEIQGRIKDSMLAGNIYELLKKVDYISSDTFRKGGLFTPALGFKKMKVAF